MHQTQPIFSEKNINDDLYLTLCDTAKSLYDEDKYLESLAISEQALAIENHTVKKNLSYYTMADCHRMLKNFETSKTLYDIALYHFSAHAWVWNNRAFLYRTLANGTLDNLNQHKQYLQQSIENMRYAIMLDQQYKATHYPTHANRVMHLAHGLFLLHKDNFTPETLAETYSELQKAIELAKKLNTKIYVAEDILICLKELRRYQDFIDTYHDLRSFYQTQTIINTFGQGQAPIDNSPHLKKLEDMAPMLQEVILKLTEEASAPLPPTPLSPKPTRPSYPIRTPESHLKAAQAALHDRRFWQALIHWQHLHDAFQNKKTTVVSFDSLYALLEAILDPWMSALLSKMTATKLNITLTFCLSSIAAPFNSSLALTPNFPFTPDELKSQLFDPSLRSLLFLSIACLITKRSAIRNDEALETAFLYFENYLAEIEDEEVHALFSSFQKAEQPATLITDIVYENISLLPDQLPTLVRALREYQLQHALIEHTQNKHLILSRLWYMMMHYELAILKHRPQHTLPTREELISFLRAVDFRDHNRHLGTLCLKAICEKESGQAGTIIGTEWGSEITPQHYPNRWMEFDVYQNILMSISLVARILLEGQAFGPLTGAPGEIEKKLALFIAMVAPHELPMHYALEGFRLKIQDQPETEVRKILEHAHTLSTEDAKELFPNDPKEWLARHYIATSSFDGDFDPEYASNINQHIFAHLKRGGFLSYCTQTIEPAISQSGLDLKPQPGYPEYLRTHALPKLIQTPPRSTTAAESGASKCTIS